MLYADMQGFGDRTGVELLCRAAAAGGLHLLQRNLHRDLGRSTAALYNSTITKFLTSRS